MGAIGRPHDGGAPKVTKKLAERRVCRAHRKDGQPCKSPPIKGGFVCRKHGGSAPQVKRKAALRLLELVDPAIATLANEMVSAPMSADRQRAANSILDRAGITRHDDGVSPDIAREILLDRLRQMRVTATQVPTGELTGEPEIETVTGELA